MSSNKFNAKVLVVGSMSMDLVVRTPQFPRSGETVFGSSFNRFPGGKGANQAVAAARLGADVTMVGKVGCDEFGDSLLDILKIEGVDIRYVLRDKQTPTGVAFINLDGAGRNQIAVVLGANLKYTSDELRQLEDIIGVHDIMMLQLETDLGLIDTAVDLAVKNHVPIILDPAPVRKLNDQLLKKVTYLTPNETEFEVLTGRRLCDVDDAKKNVKVLLEKGIQNIILTLGDKGALIAGQKEEIQYVPGFPTKVVDTVAAGDSFNGALAFALTHGKPLNEAVVFANAVGALTVTKQGAIPSLPKLSDVNLFLDTFSGPKQRTL